MDDLISRQAAIEEIAQNVLHDKEGKCSVFGALFVLQNMPTAEPRKGKWIYDPEPYPMGGAYGHYECDQCGEWIRGSMTNYCPNCGARMEEDND